MELADLKLDRVASDSLYQQLVIALATAMDDGELPPGTRLPAERELAKQLRISRTTVSSAYRELESRGLLRGHVGKGTFVCAAPESDEAPFVWRGKLSAGAQRTGNPTLRNLMRDASNPNLISFAAGGPAIECFPTAEFRRLAEQILRREASTVWGHGPTEGQPRLRCAIASRLAVKPEQVLVLPGSQQGLYLLSRCLVDPGDAVILDRPGYLGAIEAFRSAGAKLLGWDLRRADLGELEDLILHHRPKVIYTNPTFQNPTGRTLSISERKNLLKLVARYRVPLIEDDTYRELYLDEPPPPTLYELDESNVVVYLSTFSKTLAPGLRLGWIVAPEVVVDQLALLKQHTDLFTGSLGQIVVAEMLQNGLFDEHLERLRAEHGRRRNALLAALQRHLPAPALVFTRPAGGLYVWCRLGRNLTASQLLQQTKVQGVVFAGGDIFYCDGAGSHELRLAFANVPVSQVEQGIQQLAKGFALCEASRPQERSTMALV